MPNFWYRVKDFYYEHLHRPDRRIGVLLSYFNILWHDRDWDHFYFERLIEHKLKRMEKNIRNGNHTTCERDANRIKTCHLLLRRLQEQKYDVVAWKEHEARWGEFISLKIENGDKIRYSLSRENCTTEKEKEQERKASSSIFDHAARQRIQDRELFSKLLAKYVDRWWT